MVFSLESRGTRPASLDLWAGGIALQPARVLEAEIFLAADRPDRLEVALAAAGGAAVPSVLPGALLTAALEGVSIFSGRVTHTTETVAPARGGSRRIVAVAAYHLLRPCLRGRIYRHLTDSELAWRVASSLELSPCIERTDVVHAQAEIRDDPLVELRRRARARGFQLAVHGGELFFGRRTPEKHAPVRVSGTEGVLCLEITDRGPRRGGRGGFLEVGGTPQAFPLAVVGVASLDPAVDGVYRTVRVLHRVDASGYRTRLEILQDGLDYGRWQGEGRGGDDATGC